MRPNTNPETGIAYGVISANSLNPETVWDLTFNNGRAVYAEEALADLKKSIEADADAIEEEVRITLEERGGFTPREFDDQLESWVEAAYERQGFSGRDDYIETRTEKESEFIEIDEEVYEGETEGVKYRVTWLGGAQIVLIFESPVVTRAYECSPCIPGAGDLDSPALDLGVECYGVPTDWLDQPNYQAAIVI